MLPVLRMGKYVIDGLLGPGGVTETYLVHEQDKPEAKSDAPTPPLALKLLRLDRVPEGTYAKVAARFVSAGRQLRDFHRPGFCRVLDVSEDPSATFIVSEYASGCDLARLLETCQAEGKQGVHPVLVGLIGSEIARLLHVGHSARPAFGHLGLCPRNVIIAASGEMTLLDAGIAASVRAVTEQLPERWLLVAPELQGVDVAASPLGDRAAIAADLYSLGALMLLLLTGRAQMPAPRSSSQAAFELPETAGATGNLAAALRTMVSVEPADRPESAAVLVEWLAGEVAQARDRRALIAQGVRAVERGMRLSSPDLPIVVTEQGVVLQPPKADSARADKPSRYLLMPLLLLAGAVAVGAALVSRAGPDRWQSVATTSAPTTANGRPSQAGPKARTGTSEAREIGDMPPSPAALLAGVAGHLIVETVPPGAEVWVDGTPKGRTFVDIVVGAGAHDVAVILPGHRMIRDVIDTSKGAIIRRNLAGIPAQSGDGGVEVGCRTAGSYPVLLDGQETGILCPAKLSPAGGKHTVGIYVPAERRVVQVETAVVPGAEPARVTFSQ